MGLLDDTNYHIFGEGAITDDSKSALQMLLEQNIRTDFEARIPRGSRTASWKLNSELNDRIVRYEQFYKKVFKHYYYPKVPIKHLKRGRK